MRQDDGITPKVLLDHMRAMEGRLSQKISEEIRGVHTRIDRVEIRIDRVEQKLTLISTQIGNIDQRLDVIEIEYLPRRVAALEATSR